MHSHTVQVEQTRKERILYLQAENMAKRDGEDKASVPARRALLQLASHFALDGVNAGSVDAAVDGQVQAKKNAVSHHTVALEQAERMREDHTRRVRALSFLLDSSKSG